MTTTSLLQSLPVGSVACVGIALAALLLGMNQVDAAEPVADTSRDINRTKPGAYLLLYHNNDGTGEGLHGPEYRAARRSAFLARGEFQPKAHQPIWFSKPKLFIDNDGVGWGEPGKERLEAATHVSLTEQDGRRFLWYPDRKFMLLGKISSDKMLDAMKAPD
jgi:hypothetical protein